MKLKAPDIDRIEFTNGDCVSRCDAIWVGSLGDYTTTYDSISDFLEARSDGTREQYESFRRKFMEKVRI